MSDQERLVGPLPVQIAHRSAARRERSAHDDVVRAVIASAREVRLRFHDAHEVFVSILPLERTEDTFSARPWGVRTTKQFFYDDVSGAAPVRHMDWQKQRAISAAQAEAFAGPPT